MSLLSPMKKIDSFIFKQCDEFKKTAMHQKIADQNSSTPDEKRPIINFLLALTFFTLFLGFLFYFFKQNKEIRNQIQTKESIDQAARKFIAMESNLNNTLSGFLSSNDVSSSDQVNSMIRSSLGAAPKDSISITDIDTKEISSSLKKATATIEFKNLHNKQLGIFISNLANRNKIQFTSSNISRDNSTKLLNGNFSIIVFSK